MDANGSRFSTTEDREPFAVGPPKLSTVISHPRADSTAYAWAAVKLTTWTVMHPVLSSTLPRGSGPSQVRPAISRLRARGGSRRDCHD